LKDLQKTKACETELKSQYNDLNDKCFHLIQKEKDQHNKDMEKFKKEFIQECDKKCNAFIKDQKLEKKVIGILKKKKSDSISKMSSIKVGAPMSSNLDLEEIELNNKIKNAEENKNTNNSLFNNHGENNNQLYWLKHGNNIKITNAQNIVDKWNQQIKKDSHDAKTKKNTSKNTRKPLEINLNKNTFRNDSGEKLLFDETLKKDPTIIRTEQDDMNLNENPKEYQHVKNKEYLFFNLNPNFTNVKQYNENAKINKEQLIKEGKRKKTHQYKNHGGRKSCKRKRKKSSTKKSKVRRFNFL
jgi:hypothetical protein